MRTGCRPSEVPSCSGLLEAFVYATTLSQERAPSNALCGHARAMDSNRIIGRAPRFAAAGGAPQTSASPASQSQRLDIAHHTVNRRPPRVDNAIVKHRAGLPGRSVREVQRLVQQGASLEDLDWVAHGHYESKPASLYVNPDGTTTDRGGSKKSKTAAKKLAADAANALIGLARATIGLDEQPWDYPNGKRAERRAELDAFEGLTVEHVVQLANRYRNEMPQDRQTPPATPLNGG